MARYAEGTQVSVEQTKQEIERLIKRYGGEMVSFGWGNETTAVVGFRWRGRFLKFDVVIPKRGAERDARVPRNVKRTPAAIAAALDKAVDDETRRRWRVLLIRLKVKFETVDSEPELWDEEFLPNTLLPDGKTVVRWMQPQLEQAYLTGQMPAQLLLLPSPKGE